MGMEDWAFIACLIFVAAILLSPLLFSPTTVEVDLEAIVNAVNATMGK